MKKFSSIIGFQWDGGNVDKNYKKHGVSPKEAEEIFLDETLKVKKDFKHSQKEKRFIAFGKTFSNKVLFVVFTMRGELIRIISARDANRKERAVYEKT